MKNRIKMFEKYFNKKKTVEQKAILEYQKEDIANVLKRSHNFIGAKEGELKYPLVLIKPEPFGEKGKVKYKVVKLDDGTFRLDFDQSLVTSIYLTNDLMFYHEAIVNHNNGLIGFDYVGEINLFDVINTETFVTYDDFKNPRVQQLVLRLVLVNGISLEFILRELHINENFIETELMSEHEKKVINTIKNAIRQAKQ